MTDSNMRKARPAAWAMRFPNCDGSADWVELGEQMPQQWQGAVPSPLYDDAAIDAAVEQANARQNAAWRLMCDKMVAAERERCAKVAESRPLHSGMDEWDSTAAAIRGA